MEFQEWDKYADSNPYADDINYTEEVDPVKAADMSDRMNKRLEQLRLEHLQKASNEYGWLTAAFSNLVNYMFTGLELFFDPVINRYARMSVVAQGKAQEAMMQVTPTLPDPALLIMAQYQHPDMADEIQDMLARHGFSPERRLALARAMQQPLQDEDIKTLLFRGEIDDATATDMLWKLGVTPENAESKKSAWYGTMGLSESRDAMFRGLIDDETLNRKLNSLGVKDEDKTIIKELMWERPPVQDLVRMAVREVWSPAIASEFGITDEFPDKFAEEARKSGLSEEWAEAYWAAHWELPSLTMGYEMFHRGIIDEGQLDLLMKAQDVMPYWRDKLMELSYNPLTRVDVRRMHALGVLDRSGVLKAYQDVGYSPENAELMTQFTEAYNLGTERDLSKTEITNAYMLGIFDRYEAVESLVDLGYSDEEADTIIKLKEVKEEIKLVDKQSKAIVKRYERGIVTRASAMGELKNLGLKTDAITRMMDTAEINKMGKIASLPRKDVDKAFKEGIIKEPEYRKRLSAMGFQGPDIEILTKLTKES